MRAALVGTDRPWHCAGARVRVRPEPEGGGSIEVTLATGVTLRRRVHEPHEAADTMLALLIVEVVAGVDPPRPSMGLAPPSSVPTRGTVFSPSGRPSGSVLSQRQTASPASPGSTRWADGFVELGPRVGGPSAYASLAVRLTVAFRFEPWSMLVWTRVEPWTARLAERGPGRYLLDPGVLGVGATWGALTRWGRVEAGGTLSTNTYTWRDQGLAAGQREAFAQVRVGAIARWRFRPRYLGVSVTLDGDVAPSSWLEPNPSPTLPRAPFWSAGLLVGLAYGGAL